MTNTVNYLHTSEWGTCLHCSVMHRGHHTHYCGGPYQSVPQEEGFDHTANAAAVKAAIERRAAAPAPAGVPDGKRWEESEPAGRDTSVVAMEQEYDEHLEAHRVLPAPDVTDEDVEAVLIDFTPKDHGGFATFPEKQKAHWRADMRRALETFTSRRTPATRVASSVTEEETHRVMDKFGWHLLPGHPEYSETSNRVREALADFLSRRTPTERGEDPGPAPEVEDETEVARIHRLATAERREPSV